MSHYPERKEKDCLNCGTMVEGRFCQICGQENIVPKETFWGLLTHFVYDITHFDSKFFSTLKYLFTKPGFLSLEFLKGRRASYLHPIRMYVFTSALFFVIFFTLYSASSIIKEEQDIEQQRSNISLALLNIRESAARETDPVFITAAGKAIDKLKRDSLQLEAKLVEKNKEKTDVPEVVNTVKDSLEKKGIPVGKSDWKVKTRTGRNRDGEFEEESTVILDSAELKKGLTDFGYRSQIAYTAMQESLPADKRDSWGKRIFMTRLISVVEEQKEGKKAFLRAYLDNLLHSFPKMLFISLPLFALLLKLLYLRRRDLYFSDHAIFTIHLYCATFIFLLAWFGLIKLEEYTNWGFLTALITISVFLIYFYLYKAMRRFYGQSRRKTIVKFLLLNLLSFIMMVFLLSIFTILSATSLSSGAH